MGSGNKIEYYGENTRAQTNSQILRTTFSTEQKLEQFRESRSRSRPSSELWIPQANAPDECGRCAYQHCSCPEARVKQKNR
eukprot:3452285-Pyramimonas_sp.AAC.1